MKEIAVSVIVPAYNAEATIGETLASALAQTYESLEVIVVDDGSRDRTAEIVEAIAARDARVRLLRQPNRGVAAARNLAIEHARGEYIAPLDADDLWYPEKLEAQVERLEAGGEAMGFVYSWWVNVDERGRVIGATTPWDAEGQVYERLLYVNFIGNASVPLFRRSVLEEVGLYDTSLRARGGQGCEDWDVTLRVAARYEVGLAPGYLVGYRTVQGSMSYDSNSMARSYELVMAEARQQYPELPDALFRWSKGNFFTYLASMSYASQRYRDTLYWFMKAAATDPLILFASHTTRLTLRSLVWMVMRPLASRLWPERQDWIAFKKQLGLHRLAPTTREVVEEGAVAVPTPWKSGKPFDRIRNRRWEQVSGEGSVSAGPSDVPPERGPGDTDTRGED